MMWLTGWMLCYTLQVTLMTLFQALRVAEMFLALAYFESLKPHTKFLSSESKRLRQFAMTCTMSQGAAFALMGYAWC
jgi:hypothetical protein